MNLYNSTPIPNRYNLTRSPRMANTLDLFFAIWPVCIQRLVTQRSVCSPQVKMWMIFGIVFVFLMRIFEEGFSITSVNVNTHPKYICKLDACGDLISSYQNGISVAKDILTTFHLSMKKKTEIRRLTWKIILVIPETKCWHSYNFTCRVLHNSSHQGNSSHCLLYSKRWKLSRCSQKCM